MTDEQRKAWARAVIKYPPPPHMYHGINYREASLRTAALITAAAQLDVWTYLPQHLVLVNAELQQRPRRG